MLDLLCPPTFTLQVFTEDNKLVCREVEADDVGLGEKHPAVPEAVLRAMGFDLEAPDFPVVEASEVLLVRCIQNFVWLVKVDGVDMVCKISLDIFKHAIGHELETYLKIRRAGVELKIPQLKGWSPYPSSNTKLTLFLGVVKSHKGVIGILLNHIPHKHHSLRTLLHGVKGGTIPATEASMPLKLKWAAQIQETLAGLHELGILWRDVKTDNILIDDTNNDAVLLDFGGGNTVGWVDREKYGTMEGEAQGLRKILDALEIEG